MELEIKLNVKPAIVGGPFMLFTKLAMHPSLAGKPLGPISKVEIRDLYYDTADQKLAGIGAGLRVRVQNNQPFITLKINRHRDGSLTQREEFEEPLVQERLDWVLAHVKEQIGEGPFAAEDFLNARACGGLVPILEAGTARLLRPIGNEAELTLDLVEYPGISAAQYFDIEVESVAGEAGERVLRQVEDDLYRLAGGDLAPAKLSKLERGLKLKGKARI